MDIKKIRKKEMPPREGFDVELHLITVSAVFRIPNVETNFKNNPFIKKERITMLKKYDP